MREFDPREFKRLAVLPENALMDRKSELYRVSGKDSLPNKAEFIRDMIALANSARQRGEPAYLLFGVADYPTSKLGIVGIGNQSFYTSRKESWMTLPIEKRQEQIERIYQQIIQEYVKPPLDFEYLYGYIDGKLVSYIIIEYNPSAEPFEIRKQIASKQKRHVKGGECWIRKGESKHFVPPHEKRYLYRYDDLPFITKGKWKIYAQQCIAAYDRPLTPEISLIIAAPDGEELEWEEYTSRVMTGDDQITLLTGVAGAGKTTTLQRLVSSLAYNLLYHLEATTNVDEHPTEPIPIYLDLNGRAFRNNEELRESLISDGLAKFSLTSLRKHPRPFEIFRRGRQKFIVIMDGLDEIEPSERKQTLATLHNVITSLRNTQFIIAGREGPIPKWLQKYPSFSIKPVTRPALEDFLQATLQPETAYEARKLLMRSREFYMMSSSPLAIRAVSNIWQQWECSYEEYREALIEYEQRRETGEREKNWIPFPNKPAKPSTVAIIQEVIEDLLMHDRAKGLIEDESWLYKLGRLALWMKVKGRENLFTSTAKVKEWLGDDKYDYCLHAGILCKDGNRAGFPSHLFLDYFAAYGLKESLEDVAEELTLTWEQCGQMLQDLMDNVLPMLIAGYVHAQLKINHLLDNTSIR